MLVARATGPETSTWGVNKDVAPFRSRACLACHYVSPTLPLQSAPPLHGPPGPTQCRTCQTKHDFPCGAGASATTCTQNAHTHRRAARPQAAHILKRSPQTSGRSCASSKGCSKTLPALPLWAVREERGSGANMPLLPSCMTLPIPSRDSPDKHFGTPAKRQSFRSDSCSSDANSTFMAPGSGHTRIQKHTGFPGGQARESGAALTMQIRHMPLVRPKLRYSPLQRRKAENICCSFFQERPTKPDIGPEESKSPPLCINKNVA